MRANVSLTAVLALSAVMAACQDRPAAQPPAAAEKAPAAAVAAAEAMPNWSEAFSHQVRYDPAEKAVVVDVEIQPGFHAYTTGETTGKPLRVELNADGPYRLNGPVLYPKGTEKNLPIGKSVIVEGKASVVAKVIPRGEATKDPVQGTFRYQVCTDEACDRPRKSPFEVALTSSP